MPGCNAGTIFNDLKALEEELKKVQYNLKRDDAKYNFTVRINCGVTHVSICGGIHVFCLGRGFPGIPDVDISDILSTYQPITRLSILCHEICGHAIATWNEQYAPCGASCGFLPSPGWRDFMNTGPESRHGFSEIELERWARTMYELQQDCSGPTDPSWGGTWNPCTGLWEGPPWYPWDFNPITGVWQDKAGISEFCCQQPYGGIYNRRLGTWSWTVNTTWNWSVSDPIWRCVTGCP